jgi:hypothetical protein
VEAKAACEACRPGECVPVDCGEPGSARGYKGPGSAIIFIFDAGNCPNLQQLVQPGDGFTPFDGVVANF